MNLRVQIPRPVLKGEIMKLTEKDIKRFWAKIKKGKPNECWEWQGATRPTNWYGCFKLNGKAESAHRIVYYLTYKEKPEMVCHHCDNPLCCNPAHLFGGTRSDNMKDAYYKGRFTIPGQKLTKKQVKALVKEYKKNSKLC